MGRWRGAQDLRLINYQLTEADYEHELIIRVNGSLQLQGVDRTRLRRRPDGEFLTRKSATPCTWRRPLQGTWETSFVSGHHTGPAHEGNSRTLGMHANKGVGRLHSTGEASNNAE